MPPTDRKRQKCGEQYRKTIGGEGVGGVTINTSYLRVDSPFSPLIRHEQQTTDASHRSLKKLWFDQSIWSNSRQDVVRIQIETRNVRTPKETHQIEIKTSCDLGLENLIVAMSSFYDNSKSCNESLPNTNSNTTPTKRQHHQRHTQSMK